MDTISNKFKVSSVVIKEADGRLQSNKFFSQLIFAQTYNEPSGYLDE